MTWRESTYRGTPYQLSEGDEPNFFDANWGATKKVGAGLQNVRTRYKLEGRAESAITASLAGQGGGESQVGKLVEIDGSPSSGLEIIVDAAWSGIQEIIGAGGSNLLFGSMVVDDDGPVWPSPGSSYIESNLVYVDHEANALDIGNPPVFQGQALNDGSSGNPEPHYISNPSDGDVYRIIGYVQTKASVPFSGASARSDAMNDNANAFNGYIVPTTIGFNWV